LIERHTGGICRPGGNIFKERSRVRIVNHGHVRVASADVVDKISNINVCFKGLA